MAIVGFPRTPGTNSRPFARKLPLTLLGPTLGNPQMLDRPDGSRTSPADRSGGSRPPCSHNTVTVLSIIDLVGECKRCKCLMRIGVTYSDSRQPFYSVLWPLRQEWRS